MKTYHDCVSNITNNKKKQKQKQKKNKKKQ